MGVAKKKSLGLKKSWSVAVDALECYCVGSKDLLVMFYNFWKLFAVIGKHSHGRCGKKKVLAFVIVDLSWFRILRYQDSRDL